MPSTVMTASSNITVRVLSLKLSSTLITPLTEEAAELAATAEDAQVMPGTFSLIFRSAAADSPGEKRSPRITNTGITNQLYLAINLLLHLKNMKQSIFHCSVSEKIF
jgi:hypothetical protein